MRRTLAGLLGAAATLVSGAAVAASAAKSSAAPARVDLSKTPPMEVHLVRSNEPGCEPNCPQWIAAQGRIDSGTLRRFNKAIAKAGQGKLPVLIHSPGGSVSDALAIARLIRKNGLDVVVGKTEFDKCAPRDAACRKLEAQGIRFGMPAARGSVCASACPFVLAGGVRRLAGPGGAVGVHRISSFQVYTKVLRQYRVVTKTEWGIPVAREKQIISEKTLSKTMVPTVTADKTYAELRAFFTEMGVSNDIMPLVQRTPSDRMHWLSAREVLNFKLVNTFASGQQLLRLGRVKVAPAGAAMCRPKLGILTGCDPALAPGGGAGSPAMDVFGVRGAARPIPSATGGNVVVPSRAPAASNPAGKPSTLPATTGMAGH